MWLIYLTNSTVDPIVTNAIIPAFYVMTDEMLRLIFNMLPYTYNYKALAILQVQGFGFVS